MKACQQKAAIRRHVHAHAAESRGITGFIPPDKNSLKQQQKNIIMSSLSTAFSTNHQLCAAGLQAASR